MFQENVILSRHSNFKIGGPARYFFEAKNVEEIIKAVDKARQMKLPIFILGGGTNILFSDEGFNGLIFKIQNSKIKNQNDNSKFKIIKAEAGVPLSELVGITAGSGLSGLEWAAGIPGTVGGAIFGNAGAFGGEIKNIVKEVISLDISNKKPRIIKRSGPECRFAYRRSVFKEKRGQEIIIEATLHFKKGDKKRIQEIMEANMDYRRQKQPLEYPNIGSIFKNVPLTRLKADKYGYISINQGRNQRKSALVIKTDHFPVIPAAYLIAEAGLKGVSYGGAMISPKHPNFIVNVLDATSGDVKKLIELVKKEVFNKFKIKLEEEVVSLV